MRWLALSWGIGVPKKPLLNGREMLVFGVVALVALVALVAIVCGRQFYGKADLDGAEMRVGGGISLTAPQPSPNRGEPAAD